MCCEIFFGKHHVIFYYFSVSSQRSQLRATQGSRHHLIIWLAAAFATTKSFFFSFPTVRYYNKTSFKFSKLGTSFLSWPHTMKLCETFRKQRNIRPLVCQPECGHHCRRGCPEGILRLVGDWTLHWWGRYSNLLWKLDELWSATLMNWSLFWGSLLAWDTTSWVVKGSLNLPFPLNLSKLLKFLGKTFNWAGQTRSLPVVNLSRIRGQ